MDIIDIIDIVHIYIRKFKKKVLLKHWKMTFVGIDAMQNFQMNDLDNYHKITSTVHLILQLL